MGATVQSYSQAATKGWRGIRVLLCDPDGDVRARLRDIIDSETSLTVVAECSAWTACEAEIERLVPELMVVRDELIPADWMLRNAGDTFAPVILALAGGAVGQSLGAPSFQMKVPLETESVRSSLGEALNEIYDRKAKQLLYLVGHYVAGASSVARFDPLINAEMKGEITEVRTESITAIVAARKFVILHTADGEALLREPIHRVTARLDPAMFLRIHRSVIINCSQLNRQAVTEKSLYAVMLDGSRYPIGRNFRQSLAARLQSLIRIS